MRIPVHSYTKLLNYLFFTLRCTVWVILVFKADSPTFICYDNVAIYFFIAVQTFRWWRTDGEERQSFSPHSAVKCSVLDMLLHPLNQQVQEDNRSNCPVVYVSFHLCPSSCLNLYLCSSSARWCSVGQCIVCVSTWTPPSAGISASSCPPGPETSPLHLLEFPESQHACEHSAASQACTHEFRLEGWAELQHLCCSVWHFYCTTCFHLSVRVARGGWVSLQICPSFQSGPNCWAGRWTAGGAAVVGGF